MIVSFIYSTLSFYQPCPLVQLLPPPSPVVMQPEELGRKEVATLTLQTQGSATVLRGTADSQLQEVVGSSEGCDLSSVVMGGVKRPPNLEKQHPRGPHRRNELYAQALCPFQHTKERRHLEAGRINSRQCPS